MTEQKFKVGDWVEIIGVEGEAEDLKEDYAKNIGCVARVIDVDKEVVSLDKKTLNDKDLPHPYLHNVRKVDGPREVEAKLEFNKSPMDQNFTFRGIGYADLSTSSERRTIMSRLQTIPARIKRVLNKNARNFYQLGWIDEELNPTKDGLMQLNQLLWDEYEDKLGALASKKEIDEYASKNNYSRSEMKRHVLRKESK